MLVRIGEIIMTKSGRPNRRASSYLRGIHAKARARQAARERADFSDKITLQILANQLAIMKGDIHHMTKAKLIRDSEDILE